MAPWAPQSPESGASRLTGLEGDSAFALLGVGGLPLWFAIRAVNAPLAPVAVSREQVCSCDSELREIISLRDQLT